MHNQFGTYLNSLRISRGVTVRQLSNRIGLSASHISNIENGTRLPPKTDSLIAMSEALDLSPEERVNFFNYAAHAKSNHKDIPEDILVYMSDNKETINVIKLGKRLKYDGSKWEKVIEFMSK